jgi:hypothetical protein
MTKIFQYKNNTGTYKKFLIAKDSNEACTQWVEICIDYETDIFTAIKRRNFVVNDEWVPNDDYTFPSSLLGEFLRFNG